jgi:aryl-alcohol dehydrogenase-like predicted oxidoreductase
MQYVRLGRTGLQVSRLCLGTMNFGPLTSEADSFAIMDRALELGINFFDTANVYGWKTGEGVTEQIIGRWLAQGGGRRERIVLATKVYGRMGTGPNDTRLSALHIRRACDESLRRLQTDHIDLYQMHHVDRSTPWDEIWQAFDVLIAQEQGDLRGQQLRRLAHPAQASGAAASRHALGLVSEQSLYNLTARTIELEVIPVVPGARARRDPVEPARRRPARRRARQADGGPARVRSAAQGDRARNRSSSRSTRASAASWVRRRPTSRSRGSCISPP